MQAICDVLQSASVESPFTHEEIARSILHAFVACGIQVVQENDSLPTAEKSPAEAELQFGILSRPLEGEDGRG